MTRPAVVEMCPSPRVRLFLALLAVVALVIASYLTYASVSAGASPVGCGAELNCGKLLASKWSKFSDMPVSAMAVVVYGVMLGALAQIHANSLQMRQVAWIILPACAASVLGAAGWFIYVPIRPADAICPYCMFDHICGIVLVALILFHAPIGVRSRYDASAPVKLSGM